jgi:heat shock protein HspQ
LGREREAPSGKLPAQGQSRPRKGSQSENAKPARQIVTVAGFGIRRQGLYMEFKELRLMPMKASSAKFAIGQVVRHRYFDFRGLIFDVDPEFDNTEEWWLSIPEEVRPRKDQPFYHLFAENAETEYIAYVSEQNLLVDDSAEPLRNPMIPEMFVRDKNGAYRAKPILAH